MRETIKTIGNKTVESSLGWKVDILSVNVLRYMEEGKTIDLEIEDRPNVSEELEWIIYTPPTWFWNANVDEPIAQEKISKIINRIELSFWKMDMSIKDIM